MSEYVAEPTQDPSAEVATSLERLEAFIKRGMHTPYDEAELDDNAFRLGEYLFPVAQAAYNVLPPEPDYTGVSPEDDVSSRAGMWHHDPVLHDYDIRRPCAYRLIDTPKHVFVRYILPLDGSVVRVRFQTSLVRGVWGAGLSKVMDYKIQTYRPEQTDLLSLSTADGITPAVQSSSTGYHGTDLMEFTRDPDGTSLHFPSESWDDTRSPQEKHVLMRQAARLALVAFATHIG